MKADETTKLKTPGELVDEVESLAQAAKNNHRLGESYVIQSNARVITSNAKNEIAIIDLTRKLEEFNQKAGDQTQKLISLTWAIVILTVLMLIGLGIQIWSG
ncbi:hypothetical protein A2115_03540 [Candidatus Woesebacteria bacterium GWA1_41_8]|uniref:Uncharacterized protein n=1 Tax=Candidatus Woesebacteria bacterium GWA1_41_8 TaxID=1802471 RepID=A0A1F7WJD4_9BACT|nr:MAG: hypothetical protein A2115_03540 [Candidatus Woesebacteria bacterium GWA1_41_8]